MADCLYVCLQDDDKIARFVIDPGTGGLTRQADVPVAGGPSVTALSPDRRVLYVGLRTRPAISSFRVDPSSGALTAQGTVASADAPTFLATDRAGRFLLSAYYQGGYAAVHPLGSDGAVGAPALDRYDTANGAHAIATDPSNRFAFVPHIARLQDNVLEPPKNNPGPNFIAQFRFDAGSGRHGYRKAGVPPHRWRDRRADAAHDPERRPAPGGGAGSTAQCLVAVVPPS